MTTAGPRWPRFTLRQQGVPAVVMTSSFMPQVAEVFTSDKAIAALAVSVEKMGTPCGTPKTTIFR